MIKIYDNLLPEKLVDEIDSITTNSNFPWFKATNSFYSVSEKTSKKHKDTPNVVNTPQLVHQFFSEDGSSTNSVWQDIPVALVQNFFAGDKNNMLESVDIIRAKANLMLKTQFDQNCYNPPHTDMPIPHNVLLYYVNNSDGDTIIFDKGSDNKIYQKISPKKGRLLYFDGDYYHSSSPPVLNDHRIVVNINLAIT